MLRMYLLGACVLLALCGFNASCFCLGEFILLGPIIESFVGRLNEPSSNEREPAKAPGLSGAQSPSRASWSTRANRKFQMRCVSPRRQTV